MGQAAFGQHLVAGVVHAAKVHGGGGAVGQQRGHDHVVHALCKGRVAVTRLQREGVVLQPDFQGHIQRLAVLRPLRRVHMQVHHAGQQIAASGQAAQRACGGMGLFLLCPAWVAVLNHGLNHALRIHADQHIGLHAQLVGRGRIKGRALQRPGAGRGVSRGQIHCANCGQQSPLSAMRPGLARRAENNAPTRSAK